VDERRITVVVKRRVARSEVRGRHRAGVGHRAADHKEDATDHVSANLGAIQRADGNTGRQISSAGSPQHPATDPPYQVEHVVVDVPVDATKTKLSRYVSSPTPVVWTRSAMNIC
jgi:hypothetical protein